MTIRSQIEEDLKNKQLAFRHNVMFNGMQDFRDGRRLPMFTHEQYGTFIVQENETLKEAIERKREQFEGGKL